MVNFDKYIYNGWGLSKSALIKLKEIIEEYNLKRVIEFGSGQSTWFLNDIGIDYISFDDNINYSAKLDNVIIRNLIQLNDGTFNDTITNKINYLDICENQQRVVSTHTRQGNCFYRFESNDITGEFDLVIIDGPHGNGRSIAFNVIKPFLSNRAFILVDDYNHYPFIEHLKNTFPNATLHYSHNVDKDSFEIYKIS
jgi:hypothetical protein